MAIALRALRSSVGATIDGQFFPHDAWVVVDGLTPELEAALQKPAPPVHGKALLQSAEIGADGDPICDQYFPLANQAPAEIEPADGLDELGFKALVEVAKTEGLAIQFGSAKAGVIDQIRAARRRIE